MTEHELIRRTINIAKAILTYKNNSTSNAAIELANTRQVLPNFLEQLTEEILNRDYYNEDMINNVTAVFYTTGNININADYFEDTDLVVFSLLRSSKSIKSGNSVIGKFQAYMLKDFRTDTMSNLIEDCLKIALKMLANNGEYHWKFSFNGKKYVEEKQETIP